MEIPISHWKACPAFWVGDHFKVVAKWLRHATESSQCVLTHFKGILRQKLRLINCGNDRVAAVTKSYTPFDGNILSNVHGSGGAPLAKGFRLLLLIFFVKYKMFSVGDQIDFQSSVQARIHHSCASR